MALRLLLDAGKRVGSNGRMVVLSVAAPAHAAENEQIEEVHAAEDDQHHSNLDRESLDAFLRAVDCVAELQGHADVAEVNQVEPDYEQVIDGVRERLIAVEDVDQEDTAVFVKRVGDPDCQGDADRQVNQVGAYYDIHGQPP